MSTINLALIGCGSLGKTHARCINDIDGARFIAWCDVEQRDDQEGFLLENRAFITALRKGRAPELTAADGIQATHIVLAADKAIHSGEVQHLG
jgi:predicted dehydrogenase